MGVGGSGVEAGEGVAVMIYAIAGTGLGLGILIVVAGITVYARRQTRTHAAMRSPR